MRGNRLGKAVPQIANQFQFTPLREGQPGQALHYGLELEFQFTPLREGQHTHKQPTNLVQFISIHAPA